MSRIPPELYRPIVQNVDTRTDLRTLLFVSRDVSSEAERVLYHTIHRTGDNPMRSIQLFQYLACCSRAARLVRELEISGAIHSRVIGRAGMDPGQFWPILNRALRALDNLRILWLSTYLYDRRGCLVTSEYPPDDIFYGCSFKLEVIKLPRDTAKNLPNIDLTQVKELFLGERSWSHINWDHRDNIGIEFPQGAFSTLRVLSCHSSQLLKLGGHNTQQLKALELFNTPLSNFWTDKSFPSVTSLKVYPADGTMRSFPSLRFLCMQVDDSYLESETSLSDVVKQLTVLKNLEKLCLITFEYLYQIPDGIGDMFFSKLGTLKELIVSPPSMQDGSATRWDRAGGSETVRADIEAEWKDSCWL